MADIAELGFSVDTKDLKSASSELKTLSGSANSAAKAAKTFVRALAIGATINKVVDATIVQEQAIAQLEQTLKSTGRYTPELSKSLQDYASSLQNVTTFGDEAVIASEALLLTFTKIGGEQFERAQMAILDVATAMKIDLKSATIQVGKALNDPILGMTALSRSGIQFTESQKKVVKQMIAAGDAAGAQKVILAELETQFGGSARTARDTLGGALKSLSNAFGDLLEGDASVSSATAEINSLTNTLSDPKVKKAFKDITAGVLSVVGAVAGALPKLTAFTQWAGEELASLAVGISADDIARLEQDADSIQKKISARIKFGIPLEGLDDDLREAKAKVDAYYATIDQSAKQVRPAAKTAFVEVPVVESATTAVAELTKEQKKAIEAAKTLYETNQKTVESYQIQAATLGFTASQAELYRLELAKATPEQLASAQAALAQVDAYNAVSDAIDAMFDNESQRSSDVASAFRSAVDEILTDEQRLTEAFNARNQAYKDALEAGQVSEQRYQELLAASAAKNEEDLQAIKDKTDSVTKDINQLMQDNIQNSIVNILTDGFDEGFSGILASFGDLLIKMAIQATAADIAGQIFEGSTDNSANLASGLGNIFAGLFDSGGTIPAGKVGIAGERGPELITGPAHVTSTRDTAAMMGGGSVSIGQMVFPGITNANEARLAASQSARQIQRQLAGAQRYS